MPLGPRFPVVYLTVVAHSFDHVLRGRLTDAQAILAIGTREAEQAVNLGVIGSG